MWVYHDRYHNSALISKLSEDTYQVYKIFISDKQYRFHFQDIKANVEQSLGTSELYVLKSTKYKICINGILYQYSLQQQETGIVVEKIFPIHPGLTAQFVDKLPIFLQDGTVKTYDIIELGESCARGKNFRGCQAFRLPKHIKVIADWSFTDCEFSDDVQFNFSYCSGLEYIGLAAFAHANLSGVLIFPDSLIEIGDMAFMETKVQQIISWNGIKKYGKQSFFNCNLLAAIPPFPADAVTEQDTFAGCQFSDMSSLCITDFNKIPIEQFSQIKNPNFCFFVPSALKAKIPNKVLEKFHIVLF